MHMRSMTVPFAISAAIAATLSVAQVPVRPAPQDGPGFFRPAADPALTAIPAPAAPAAAPKASPTVQPAQADGVREKRAADETAMDRVEAVHSRAMAQSPPKAPVITSPLDGTAPILSPLDGTAPLVTPVGR